jgi:tetratricopeptide (TPR) repeat protein
LSSRRGKENDTVKELLAEGIAKGAAGDLAAARLALLSVLEIEPRQYDAWYNLGNVHREGKEYERAAACYAVTLGIDSDNHPAHYQQAVVLEGAGRTEDALRAYQEAVRTSPNPGEHWGFSGMDFTKKAQAAIDRLKKPGRAKRPARKPRSRK